jgi:hypothetical protein
MPIEKQRPSLFYKIPELSSTMLSFAFTHDRLPRWVMAVISATSEDIHVGTGLRLSVFMDHGI